MRSLAAISLALLLSGASAQARPHHYRHSIAPPATTSFWSSFSGGGSGLISSAKAHIGATASQLGLPGSLWCADFTNMVLKRAGYHGTGSRMAKSFLALPRTSPQVGAIAVMGRKGGGHVGFVSGFDSAGNPIIVSGNSNGRRVYEGPVSSRRVIAYVNPQ